MDAKLPVISQFFKVMMPGFRTRLLIPLAFCKHLRGEKSKEAVVTSRKGSWKVKVGKCRKTGQIYFEEGWDKFVQQHELTIGDFLVFEHEGNLCFEVLVYNGSSDCEKEFPVGLESGNETSSVLVDENVHKPAKLIESKGPAEETASYAPKNPHFRTTIKPSHGV